ncbi:hypothetical protein EUTSA_v10019798mg [Eutrema salsugineum]|uniref:Uncharacterized protein n=1 Tax=Eutrema salsugineum TaxID=72664 RepID=V4MBJ3_EUTSA|nr:hypothetical protein EUTSA_v10019798mg [Eutrema salsugineum]
MDKYQIALAKLAEKKNDGSSSVLPKKDYGMTTRWGPKVNGVKTILPCPVQKGIPKVCYCGLAPIGCLTDNSGLDRGRKYYGYFYGCCGPKNFPEDAKLLLELDNTSHKRILCATPGESGTLYTTDEDPYLVASASSDGVIRVWDMRMAAKENAKPLAETNTKSRLTCLAGSALKSMRRPQIGNKAQKLEEEPNSG